jgi:hypothetical protein
LLVAVFGNTNEIDSNELLSTHFPEIESPEIVGSLIKARTALIELLGGKPVVTCRRRFNIDHLCRLNFDQGLKLAV